MRIRPYRWAIMGGICGLLLGGFIAVGMYLRSLEPEPRVAPLLSTVPSTPTGPSTGAPPGGDDTLPWDDPHELWLDTARELVGPFLRNAEIDEAVALVESLGELESSSGHERDLNLKYIVESIVTQRLAGPLDGPPDASASSSAPASEPAPSGNPFGAPDAPAMVPDNRKPSAPPESPELVNPFGTPDPPAKARDDRKPSPPGEFGPLADPFEGRVAPGVFPDGRKPSAPAAFKKAIEITSKIRSPLIRARALGRISSAQMDDSDPQVRADARSTLDMISEAVKQYHSEDVATAQSEASRRRLAWSAFWVVGLAVVLALAFGLVARLLAAIAGTLASSLAEELDRELLARREKPQPA